MVLLLVARNAQVKVLHHNSTPSKLLSSASSSYTSEHVVAITQYYITFNIFKNQGKKLETCKKYVITSKVNG